VLVLILTSSEGWSKPAVQRNSSEVKDIARLELSQVRNFLNFDLLMKVCIVYFSLSNVYRKRGTSIKKM
jgi:hypothetical protein